VDEFQFSPQVVGIFVIENNMSFSTLFVQKRASGSLMLKTAKEYVFVANKTVIKIKNFRRT